MLAELFRYVPAGSQIAIASREEPALPLARWRTNGWTEEIGAADLQLNEQEAGLLLEAAGVELEESEISELTERTEGWPAGLYLAALSMQAGSPGPVGAAAFNGDDRFVSEYFHLELLSRLPPEEATFLKHTSVLDRMCGGLCDAVLQTTRSAQTLDTLARTNSFLVPLDRRGEWYRYHHLFGELLRTELERSEPEVVPELNARAMAWCIANDRTEEAVVYGRAADERSTVASLVDAMALPVYYDGRLETLEEWLSWFGEDELPKYPALAVLGAWVRGADRAARRCRAAACSRRRRNLGDPALGRQRHDPALGGHSAGPHDAERCRASARRRRTGARQARSGKLLDPHHTPGSGRCERAARRHRSCCGRTHRSRRAGAGARRRGRGLPGAGTARASRSQDREPGARQSNKHELPRHSSTRRVSATTRRARSRMWRRLELQFTRQGMGMPAQSWHGPTACGRSSTTAFHG